MSNPITFAELRERGMDDRLSEVIHTLIGDHIPPDALGQVKPSEYEALGYGPPCDCGERGLRPGEIECQFCTEKG